MGYRRFIVGAVVLCLMLFAIAVPASAKAAAKQVADPNATFTVAGASGTNPLTNPHTYAGGLSGWELYTQAYDRLLQLTPDDKNLAPMLATSWKWNSDNTQLTLSLRKDVTFQDGTPFNADSVVTNLRAGSATGSNGAVMLGQMTNVEAVDPSTARLTFSSPNPDAIFALAYYPGMMVSAKGLASPSSLSTSPQGSGPYKLISMDAALTFKFDRNEQYWNKGHVYPAHYTEYSYADENTRFNALQTGQVDFTLISSNTYNQATANKNLQVVSYTQTPPYVIFMNNTKAPFNNPDVRQAVSLALDRKAFVAGVNGLGQTEDQALPTGIDGNTPLYKAPKQNITKAKQLIQQAGATGKTVKMATITFEPFPTFSKIAQAQLNAIGLDVQLDIYQPGGTFRLQYQSGADEMLFAPTSMAIPDASQILDQFVTGIGNPGTKDSALTSKVQQAEGLVVGSKERTTALQGVNKELLDPASMLWVPVVHQLDIFAASKKVMGVKNNVPNATLSQAATFSYLQVAKTK